MTQTEERELLCTVRSMKRQIDEMKAFFKDKSQPQEYITFEKACKLLMCKRPKLNSLIKSGEIPARKVCGKWRFETSTINNYIKGN